MTPIKVVVFVRQFPCYSQTFVIQQIADLIEQGHRVEIVALYRNEDAALRHPLIEKFDMMNRVQYVFPKNLRLRSADSWKTVLKAFLNYKSECLPLLKAAADEMLQLRFHEAYKLLYLSSVSNHRIAESDVVLVHFGNMGVYCDRMIKTGLLTGRQATVFHGYEISMIQMLAEYKSEYLRLSEQEGVFLPISQYWQRRLLSWGVPESHIRVHHMGVDTARFDFEMKPIQSPLRILTVARATEKKGLIYAIKAVDSLEIDVSYEIVGDGELFDELTRAAGAMENGHRVRLVGAQTAQYVNNALKQSDIFLLPSVTAASGDMEGIPVSLMEAMASGVLVLSTLHSGIPELIEHEVTGLLVAEKDSAAIARQLLRVASREVDCDQVRMNARKKIETDFNSTKLAGELSGLLVALSENQL